MADLDIGEMFLNFGLHASIQGLCGVDLSQFFGAEVKEKECCGRGGSGS